MAINTTELLARICSIEQEATTAAGITSAAVPRWLYQSETLPYWINRIGGVALDTTQADDGQEYDVYRYTVESALIYAHASAGYNGEKDAEILSLFPKIVQYFDEREVLQSASYPVAGLDYLRLAHFLSGIGYVTFPPSAAGGTPIGSTFTWLATFDKYLTQQY